MMGYRSTEEIIGIVQEEALNTMMDLQFQFRGDQGHQVESLAVLNDRIGHFNQGVQALALILVKRLKQEEET